MLVLTQVGVDALQIINLYDAVPVDVDQSKSLKQTTYIYEICILSNLDLTHHFLLFMSWLLLVLMFTSVVVSHAFLFN